MANICENKLNLSTSNAELFQHLRDTILEMFEGELIWEDTSREEHALEMRFDSMWTFPQKEFVEITEELQEPSLVMTILATEPGMDYVGHFVYKHGVWITQSPSWETIPPKNTTGFAVSVSFSRRYTYTQEQMRERLGQAPDTNNLKRIEQAQKLAWEDLRQDFKLQKITPMPQTFELFSQVHLPEPSATEATSE